MEKVTSKVRGAVALAVAVALLGWASPPAAAASTPQSPVGSSTTAAPKACPSDSRSGRIASAPVNGPAAVKALGAAGLAEAGRRAGMSTSELSSELVADRSLWVDQCGTPFYQDLTPDASGAEEPEDSSDGQSDPQVGAGIAPADAFTLHSRPGSTHTIYLDFNGEAISGTAWNALYSLPAWTAPAFDTDGNPGSFSDTERNIIIEVWARVADDYAPFDVDVTTADPGAAALIRSSSSDNYFGARALISPDSSIAGKCGGCGGIAYVGVFDRVQLDVAYQPAWVLAQQLSYSAKYIAEAAAHEVGHNLGLSHDGTASSGYYYGSNGWAPIMGAGYYQNVTQWSRGEYAGANNTEDDIARIAASGAPLATDDVGNTAGTATAVTPGTPIQSMITSAADTDWFSFSGYGRVTIAATPLSAWPDLDVRAILTTADGTELTRSDPPYAESNWPSTSAAAISYDLPASGSYRVVVEGVGNGIAGSDGASDYGSLGAYKLTVALGTPTITAPTDLSLTVGVPVNVALAATGGSLPYTWKLLSGSLPTGLTLSSGALVGTPSAAGIFGFTVQLTDANRLTATKSLTFSVSDVPKVTSGNLSMTVGAQVASSLTATGGVAPLAWAVTSGALPAGLSLEGSQVTGTPTAAGSSVLTLRVTDANGATATKSVTYAVAAAPVVTVPSTRELTAGAAATISLTSTGGVAPLAWSLASGTLPTGLALSGSQISGTPTTQGNYPLVLRLVDANGATATGPLALTVAGGLAISSPTSRALSVGAPASQVLEARGGVAPYTWTISSGSLPPGLGLSSGTISGTPTTAGTYKATVRAADSNSASTTAEFTFVVAAAPAVTGPTSRTLTVGAHVTISPSSTGGTAPIAWSVIGTLPTGLTLSGGQITGTPTTAGSYALTLRATDANGALGSAGLTLTVVAEPTLVAPDGRTLTETNRVDLALETSGGYGALSLEVASGELPAGLALEQGRITGKVTTRGTYTFALKVTDANGAVATSPDITFVVLAAPSVGEPGSSTFTLRTPVDLTLPANGGTGPYTWRVLDGQWPTGLALVGQTLSGTPVEVGVFKVQLEVGDATGAIGTGEITFVVAQIPQVGTLTSRSIPAGMNLSLPLSHEGGADPVAWSLAAGALPPGISIVGSTLAGTPTTPGRYSMILRVTDANGAIAMSTQLTLIVTDPVSLAYPGQVTGVEGEALSLVIRATAGTGPFAFELASGSARLPRGLDLDASGLISGTPKDAGSTTVSVLVTDSLGSSSRATITFVVTSSAKSEPAPQAAAAANSATGADAVSAAETPQAAPQAPANLPGLTTLPQARKNKAYQIVLTAQGGVGTTTWKRISGKLPKGLTLSPTGRIAGKAKKAGTSRFTLEVTDSEGNRALGKFKLKVK